MTLSNFTKTSIFEGRAFLKIPITQNIYISHRTTCILKGNCTRIPNLSSNLRLEHYLYRHDISPVFTGIPVFLSCPRSFLWKSQNRFKNLDGFYGGGGVYLLGDLIDLLLSRLNTLLQCFINPIAYVGYSQFTHCFYVTIK